MPCELSSVVCPYLNIIINRLPKYNIARSVAPTRPPAISPHSDNQSLLRVRTSLVDIIGIVL